MDEGDGAQGEAVCQKAGEEVGAHLAFACALSGSTTRNRRAATRELPFACFKSTRYCGLAQLDLDGQGLGGGHGAADDSTPLIARQPTDHE